MHKKAIVPEKTKRKGTMEKAHTLATTYQQKQTCIHPRI
jgi:hypothetical protein